MTDGSGDKLGNSKRQARPEGAQGPDPEASKAVRIGLLVSLGGFVFGYDAVVISGVAEAVTAQFGLADWQMGWIVSAPTLSAMFAGLAAGYLSDLFGRRTMLVIVAALYVLSSFLSFTADGFLSLVLARAVGGLAFSSLVIAPIYLAEISPSNARGRIVSMNQLAIVLGLSSAYFVNVLILQFSQMPGEWVDLIGMRDESWRWMLGVELLPASLWLLALLLRTPESPRWLILRGHTMAAEAVLARIYSPDRITAVLARVRANIDESRRAAPARMASLRSPPVLAALGVGLIVAVAQQVTGVNAIYFYAPTVFQQSGVGTDAAFLQASLLGLTNVVFTILAMSLIDRIGRKPLLLAGLAGIAASTLIVAAGFAEARYQLATADLALASADLAPLVPRLQAMADQVFASDVAFKTALIEQIGMPAYRVHQAELISLGAHLNSGLVLFGILMFVASFAASLGPVMWVLLSEIFPNRVRGLSIALLAFVNGAVSFGVQLVFPVQLARLGVASTFLFYAIAALIFLVLVARFVPETRGKTLES